MDRSDNGEWCALLTYKIGPKTYVTKRDGSIRVCLDPRQLNKALIRIRHKTPTLDDLNHKFANAKCFSKLDAKAGYWSIKLDEESQKLTTFQTPFGRYCFRRLPFGLSVSSTYSNCRCTEYLNNALWFVGSRMILWCTAQRKSNTTGTCCISWTSLSSTA